MGKANRRDRKKIRKDPIAKPVKPPSDPELAAIREAKILPLIEALKSSELQKQTDATRSIIDLIPDTKCRKLLLREQLVAIILDQIIPDPRIDSKCFGWTILQNLAQREESDFCIHLYRQDILVAIDLALSQVSEAFTDVKGNNLATLTPADVQNVWNLTSSILNLLASLVDAQVEILDAVTANSRITDFLFGVIHEATALHCPDHVLDEVAICLLAMTEDDSELATKIATNKVWFHDLQDLRHPGLRGAAVCGILHNMSASLEGTKNPLLDASIDASLVGRTSEIITWLVSQKPGDTGVAKMALRVIATIASDLEAALERGVDDEEEFAGFDDENETMQDGVEEGDAMDEGDEDDEDERDEAEIDDEMTAEEIEEDMALVTGDADVDDEDSTTAATLKALAKAAGPDCISALIVREVLEVRMAALSALSNIAWLMSSVDFSSNNLGDVEGTWAVQAQTIWSSIVAPVLASNTADLELASSITSIAWAIARSSKGNLQLQGDEHHKFMGLYQASMTMEEAKDSEDPFQNLGVKCVGVLGGLAMNPAPVEINREIGIFLMTILTAIPETPTADAIEALNQIFDLYGDGSFACEEVYRTHGFHKHLEEIGPKFKKVTKAIDKRKFPELRIRADETVLNLQRFLKYKKDESAAQKK